MNIGLVEHFLLMPWFNSSTFEKLYFLKMGPIFAGSYATQNKPIKKTICWHQLFRQKWAFSRLSTSVLHKCGHTSKGVFIYITWYLWTYLHLIQLRWVYQESFLNLFLIHSVLVNHNSWSNFHTDVSLQWKKSHLTECLIKL